MSIVLIGDIGWRNHSHLGDDAMTEAAIAELKARGRDDVVLTAGHPDAATEVYGLPAVPRFGIAGSWDRARAVARVDEIVQTADRDHPTVAAIASADALLIAGGGNLNSRYLHLALDRICAVRLAEKFGVPIFVSSQTVGPIVSDEDRALIMEIPEKATLFGARDSASARAVAGATGVVRTMDDAVALAPSAVAGLPERFVVGSFAPNPEGSGLTAAEYAREIARTLDGLSSSLDAEILLIPHIGSLLPGTDGVDQRIHAEIIASSGSGRLRDTGMMSARDAIAYSEQALLSISTRYHPTVFAPMVGTPAIGIALNYYSSIRMRGALENVGLEDFVAPAETWLSGGVEAMATELVARSDEFSTHMAEVRVTRERELAVWWDALAAGMSGATVPAPPDLAEVPNFEPRGEWGVPLRPVTRVSDQLGLERLQGERQAAQIEELQAAQTALSSKVSTMQGDLAASRAQLESSLGKNAKQERELTGLRSALAERETELDVARSRRSVRIADALGSLLRGKR
ncbi:polysaccharide pyruvyl transferase family protein [Agromyces sp. NPDC058110]|uniref:polysaccharide pyruvyl transferase family protein n=1 Tax=Agromyces sp. NPDC058110 TaxID=3346345 RepID=UPI0036DB2A55